MSGFSLTISLIFLTSRIVDIPDPQNEPVIGVIDTFFDESVYFSKWVDNKDYISDLEKYQNDLTLRDHGTEVTSIIVDGPRMNPWLVLWIRNIILIPAFRIYIL